MDKQTIINRLEALDLSQYPYFEIQELIRVPSECDLSAISRNT